MFVDSNRTGPWVLAHAKLFIQARVESFKYVAGADPISFLDTFQVHEVFAGPEDRTLEAFGGPTAFPDPGNIFREGFLAFLAPEAPFFNLKKHDLISDGSIFHGAK